MAKRTVADRARSSRLSIQNSAVGASVSRTSTGSPHSRTCTAIDSVSPRSKARSSVGVVDPVDDDADATLLRRGP